MTYSTTFRLGEKQETYGIFSYGSGSVRIQGTPTCTLYDKYRKPVFSGRAVTNYDHGSYSQSAAMYLINTAADGVIPGTYTLTFTATVVDSDGNTKAVTSDVSIRVAEAWENINEYTLNRPSGTVFTQTNYWGSTNFIVTNKCSDGSTEATTTAGAFTTPATPYNGSCVINYTFVDTTTSLQVAFQGASIEVPTGNTETIACSMRYLGVNYQFTFGGSHTGTLLSSGTLLSDVLTAPAVTKGSVVPFCIWSSVPAGGRWPLTAGQVTTESGTGFTLGSDLTPGLTAPSAVLGYARGINAVLGTPASKYLSLVLANGDSLSISKGEIGSVSGIADAGYVGRILNNRWPYYRIGAGTEQMTAFNITTNSATRRNIIQQTAFTHAMLEYGNNDLMNAGLSPAATLAAIQVNVNYLLGRGIVVDFMTVTPRTTSSDGWKTLGAQTLDANNTNRVTFNNLVRAGGLVGVRNIIEAAWAVESSPDSGKWNSDGSTLNLYTLDGTHPSGYGYQKIADGNPTLDYS